MVSNLAGPAPDRKACEVFGTLHNDHRMGATAQHAHHLSLRSDNAFRQRAAYWPDDGRSMWKDASAQDELYKPGRIWPSVSRVEKGSSLFPSLSLMANTPDEFANADALTKAVWNTLYPRLINAIRAEDPERWIIVEPIWGNVDNLAALTVSSAPNLIYSFHFYEPHFFTRQGVRAAIRPRNRWSIRE